MPKEPSDRPLLVKEWQKQIPQNKGHKPKTRVILEHERLVLTAEEFKSVEIKRNRKAGTISIVGKSDGLGVHRFPPAIRTVRVASKTSKRKVQVGHTDGFLPTHLPLTQFPKTLPKNLQLPPRYISQYKGRGSLATNIFGADDRYSFSDTSFPWCTCGRIDTAAGWGSGVMVGPRHVMTASHAVNWGSGNTAGWLKFTPLFFDESTPFGIAWATKVYWWKQNRPPTLSDNDVAFDYVVAVLDSRLGDVTGWMGSRGYDSDWNGGNYWGHVGYPSDISGGKRPAFIGYQSFVDSDSESTSGRDSFLIDHDIDVIPGQSGGPYFGWWSGEPWPRVVSIQSGQQHGGATGPNDCGGGNALPELISYAIANDP